MNILSPVSHRCRQMAWHAHMGVSNNSDWKTALTPDYKGLKPVYISLTVLL